MAGIDNSGALADEWPFSPEGEQPEILSAYTRSQAIADGFLASLSGNTIEGLAELCRQHFPGADVACTTGVFSLVEKAVNNKKWLNDWLGVFHDIFWMSRLKNDAGLYKLMITGTGRRRWHILRIVRTDEPLTVADLKVGKITPCVTILLPDED